MMWRPYRDGSDGLEIVEMRRNLGLAGEWARRVFLIYEGCSLEDICYDEKEYCRGADSGTR